MDFNFDKETLTGDELEVLTYPEQVLKQKAAAVEKFDEDLKTLCRNMLYTMYHAPGIGLAAPQIGVSQRIFVIDTDFTRDLVTKPDGSQVRELGSFNPRVFINPKITKMNGERMHEEGCLSFPGVFVDVKRADTIEVEYQDVNGDTHTIEADDILSICYST